MDRLTYLCTKIQEGYAAGKCGMDDGMLDRIIELGNHAAEIKRLVAADAAPKTVFVLSWDLTDANDNTGTLVFATEELAVARVKKWLEESSIDPALIPSRLADLNVEGFCFAWNEDGTYHVTETTVLTAVGD